MKKLALVLILSIGASLLASAAQKRVKQKDAADFPTLIESVHRTWKAEEYGQCSALLREATALCMVQRSRAILAALPPAPEGYEVIVDRSMEQMANNPMMSAMSASIGNVVTQEYRGPEPIKITVTADSPLVSMLNMWVANPALLEQGSELIEYGPHKAVLKSTRGGRARELMILINGAHTCQITYQGTNEDFLFELFDQQMVDALARVLGN